MSGERIELTVRLRRDGGTLRRAYCHPPYGHRPELDSSAPWDSFAGEIEFQGLTGPEAVTRLLDRGNAGELATHLTRGGLVAVGELLFALLFGAEEQWEPVLRGVFKAPSGPRPNPPRYPVRLRVLADDPLLAGLPWRITAWRGRWLLDSGWTFEAVANEEPRGHVEVRAPARVLAITPRAGEPLDTAAHFDDLRETLLKISEHYGDEGFLARVEIREDLVAAFRGMRPQVVYYYGHGAVDGGQAVLLLGKEGAAQDPWAMADFRRLLAEAPPDIVYLNACKAGAAGWLSAGHQLTPEVPCVVAHRTTAWTVEAGRCARRWFDDFLGGGLDPVEALHQLPAGGSTRDFEWATPIVWTSFESWRTHREIARRPRREPGLRLDRQTQRGMALNHVYELIASEARRVEAMVVYGAKGALVEQFGNQLRDYLESRQLCLSWLPPRDPKTLEVTFDRLEEHLGLWLERRDFESLRMLLRRQAPPRGVSPSTPVLCLDWGVFGTAGRPLSEEHLGDWLLFASDVLARHCPPEIRLVSYLALELPEAEHGPLEETVEELRAEIRSQQFRCSLLPALADVTLVDLLDYLEDPTNTHCPASLGREAARCIFRHTRGRYEETVQLIARGEDEGWNRLVRELRREKKAWRRQRARTFGGPQEP